MGNDIAGCRKEISYKNILNVTPELQEQVRSWRNSDHVRTNMLSFTVISPEQHRKWITFLERNPHQQAVRIAFHDDIPFGVITLKDIDKTASRSDWGMYIGERGFLGKGLARQMLYDILLWAFEEECLFRLFTSVLADNTLAIRLYLETGFHIEGRFEKHIKRDSGEMVDLYWIAMFKNEWTIKKPFLEMSLQGFA
jgi:UDP-4-amino-4,6-dideoxy-N-acetyl-beta-L-altrosamine N-acetyltransferase